MSPTPCPRDDCTATSHHYHTISTDGWSTPEGFGPHVPEDKPDPRPHVPEDKPDPRLHVLERRLPDWPADDLADLLAELDMEVTR